MAIQSNSIIYAKDIYSKLITEIDNLFTSAGAYYHDGNKRNSLGLIYEEVFPSGPDGIELFFTDWSTLYEQIDALHTEANYLVKENETISASKFKELLYTAFRLASVTRHAIISRNIANNSIFLEDDLTSTINLNSIEGTMLLTEYSITNDGQGDGDLLYNRNYPNFSTVGRAKLSTSATSYYNFWNSVNNKDNIESKTEIDNSIKNQNEITASDVLKIFNTLKNVNIEIRDNLNCMFGNASDITNTKFKYIYYDSVDGNSVQRLEKTYTMGDIVRILKPSEVPNITIPSGKEFKGWRIGSSSSNTIWAADSYKRVAQTRKLYAYVSSKLPPPIDVDTSTFGLAFNIDDKSGTFEKNKNITTQPFGSNCEISFSKLNETLNKYGITLTARAGSKYKFTFSIICHLNEFEVTHTYKAWAEYYNKDITLTSSEYISYSNAWEYKYNKTKRTTWINDGSKTYDAYVAENVNKLQITLRSYEEEDYDRDHNKGKMEYFDNNKLIITYIKEIR